jgi:ATP-binding cassette subfamily B protein
MQCGITCLAMICKHYGKEFSIETLSRYCFATTEGVSLLGISEAANKLGLHSVCGRVSMEQMKEAPLPCILHWNQNHFVVLYKQKRGRKFYIADPGKGLITYNRKEFAEHWVSTRCKAKRKGLPCSSNLHPCSMNRKGKHNRMCSTRNLTTIPCIVK